MSSNVILILNWASIGAIVLFLLMFGIRAAIGLHKLRKFVSAHNDPDGPTAVFLTTRLQPKGCVILLVLLSILAVNFFAISSISSAAPNIWRRPEALKNYLLHSGRVTFSFPVI